MDVLKNDEIMRDHTLSLPQGTYQKIEMYALKHDFEEDQKGHITHVNMPEDLHDEYKIDWKVKDYTSSVKKSKSLWSSVYSAHQTMKEEFPKLVVELWVARQALRNQGTLSGKSFKGYLEEIGIPRSTAYRWLKLDDKGDNPSAEDIKRKARYNQIRNLTALAGSVEIYLTTSVFDYLLNETELKKDLKGLIEKYVKVYSQKTKNPKKIVRRKTARELKEKRAHDKLKTGKTSEN